MSVIAVPLLSFAASDLGVEGVETVRPQCPVGLEPLVEFFEGLRSKGVDATLGVAADIHESCLTQDPQVS
jgi:hypothetical protein